MSRAPDRPPATRLVERRGETDFLLLFLAIVAAFAAWRGWDGNARPLAIGAGIAAIALFGWWLRWRLLPTPELRIAADEIVYGRPGSPGQRLQRGPTGRLRFEQAHERSGWLLVDADREGSSLFLLGFDLAAIQLAAEQHGWTFHDEPSPTIGPCAVCGVELEAGRQFCPDCGAFAWLACPSCGTENRNGVPACSACGTALPQPQVTRLPPFDPNLMPVDIVGDRVPARPHQDPPSKPPPPVPPPG